MPDSLRRLLPAALVAIAPALAHAQAVTITNPAISARNSFFERTGVSFGFGVGGTIRNNVPATPPPFGGFVPGAGINTGMVINGGDMTARLGIGLSQGSSRSLSTTAVKGTSFSGQPLTVIGATQRPFVTGVIPNAGFGPGAVPATIPAAPPQKVRLLPGNRIVRNGRVVKLSDAEAAEIRNRNAVASRSTRGTTPRGPSRSTVIRNQRALAKAIESLQKARAAELSGRLSVARTYYQRAMASDDANVKRIALERLAAIR